MTAPRAACLLAIVLVGLTATDARAVRTNSWQIDQPADFLAGQLDGFALTNRAELLLAPRSQRFEIDPEEADTVNVLALDADGTLYAGTGPHGIVYRLDGRHMRKVAELPDGQVFSLLPLEDGALLAGTGGERGAIWRIAPDGRAEPFWQDDEVRYVWSLVRDRAGRIYAGTGTEGTIYRISPDGRQAETLLRLKARSVLVLRLADRHSLVFGTDGAGTVGQMDLTSGQVRFLFDAGGRSISALAVQRDGAIYFAATRASKDRPTGTAPAKPEGRPDTVSTRSDDSDPGRATSSSPAGRTDGPNAVYRISPDGLVTEVMSLPVMFLAMAPSDDQVAIGTGSPGRVYLLQPQRERYVGLLAQDSAYFSAIALDDDGILWAGSSKPAAVTRIGPGCASEGTWTSAALDAGQTALWGRMTVEAALPAGTRATAQSRSSNIRDTTGPGWSAWSEPTAFGPGDEVPISAPPARFLQVRIRLEDGRREGVTPLIGTIRIAYRLENLAPEITSIKVAAPGREPAKSRSAGRAGWYPADSTVAIDWEARDPNEDGLSFDLFIRHIGQDRWVRIAHDLRKSSYEWNSNMVPDGRYELRLLASDEPDNPPGSARTGARLSMPFTVDNTPPRIDDVQATRQADGSFRVRAHLSDRGSTILDAQYAVDSAEEWTPLLPADGIFDSHTETLDFQSGPHEPGQHILAIRAVDAYGNTTYERQALTLD